MAEKMVDKVLRLMKNPEQIRNIGVCAHIDHGKTTFSDNLLSGAGMMSEELAGKARQLDFHEDEQERGITIDSASVSMVHNVGEKEFLINLIDTPGHVDFGGDVTRAMRAVDGAIVLVCASEGAMPQTETVLRQALKENVKPVLFINKTDRLIKELKLTPEQMQQRFVKHISEVNRIIKNVAPKEFKEEWQVSIEKGTVAFGSAFHNWAISLPYMQKKGISFKEIIDAYNNEEDEHAYKELAKKAPIHEVVLDMVTHHHPDPVAAQKYRIPRIWHGDLESTDGKNLVKCNPDGRTFFVITKVVVDPQAGEIAAGRLFGGTMRKGDEVWLNMANSPGRIQQVYIYNGAKKEIVDNVPAGNIIGVGGLRAGIPGETVTTGGKAEPFEKISHIFDPVVTKAIEAKKPGDLPKLIDVLRQVQKEDPTITIEINEETGEHLMHGMGELHLEVIENRIKKEKGVEVKTSPPIVVYREAITKKSPEVEGKSPNKHNKLYFIVEPLSEDIITAIKEDKIPSGRYKKKDEGANAFRELGWDAKKAGQVKDVFEGNVFLDQTRGIVQINEIMEMVLDMFEDVMKAGGLAKEPCINMMVSLMDCTLHEDAIHRGPAQMYPAVREGIRGAIMQAGPLLFEPLQIMRIECPNDYVGEVSKLVSSKRGQLLDMNQEGDITVIKAKLPVGELFGWSNDLRSATGGRGNSSLIDQMFERLPGELQDKIKNQIIQRKGLSQGELGA